MKQGQFLGYSTLAIGSAIALMLYPHTATAVLSAQSANVVRRNAAMLPAYSFLLGLIALLGYLALAAGVVTKDTNTAVPLLFLKMFPEWFAGFCLAAVAIGALVPAAIMSIAASNLFTRNLYGALVRRKMLPEEESRMAKVVSLVVKFGALLFVLKLPATYAIEMQLLGGIWMGQLFPSVVVGVFTRWFHPWALLGGMGGGDGERDGDGVGAGAEELGLSAASACVSGRDVCDVCGGACAGAESGGVCGVDRGVSCGEGGRWKRCDRCCGLCWVEL